MLVSFVWVLGGLTIGWMVIRLHDNKMNAAAFELAKDDIASGASRGMTLDEVLAQHKRTVATKKSFALFHFEGVEVDVPRTQTSAVNAEFGDASGIHKDSATLTGGGEAHDTRCTSSMTRYNNDVIKASDVGPAGIE